MLQSRFHVLTNSVEQKIEHKMDTGTIWRKRGIHSSHAINGHVFLLGNILSTVLYNTVLTYHRDPYLHSEWSGGNTNIGSNP